MIAGTMGMAEMRRARQKKHDVHHVPAEFMATKMPNSVAENEFTSIASIE